MPIKKGLRIFIHILGTVKQGGTDMGRHLCHAIKPVSTERTESRKKKAKRYKGRKEWEHRSSGNKAHQVDQEHGAPEPLYKRQEE
jgi:hypothetical protein